MLGMLGMLGMVGMVVTEVEARELQIICHWATFIATAAEVAVDSDAAFCFFPCVVLVGTFWSAMHWRGLGVVSILFLPLRCSCRHILVSNALA